MGTHWSADSQLLKRSRYGHNSRPKIRVFYCQIVFNVFLIFFWPTGPAANAPKQEPGTGEAPPAGEDEEKKKQKRGMVSDIRARFCCFILTFRYCF